MSEVIQLTPTVQANVFTEEDLLSPEELEEVLRTVPATALENYGLGLDGEGQDTPEEAEVEGVKYADALLAPVDRMKREGYTITNKADYYWFGHRKWSSRAGNKIKKLIPHHHAGNLTPKQFLAIMQGSRQMSPHISIHTNGVVYAWVPEEMRSWCTSGWEADKDSLTAELANDEIGGTWHVSDTVYKLWCQIAAEWCLRYGINPHYAPNRKGTIQMHKEWAATSCPGPYLSAKITSGQMEKDIKAIMYPKPKPKPTPAPAVKKQYVVQAGAYKTKVTAVNLAEKIKKTTNGRTGKKFDAFVKNEDGLCKVRCGTFNDKNNATQLVADLKKYAGLKDVAVIEKKV